MWFTFNAKNREAVRLARTLVRLAPIGETEDVIVKVLKAGATNSLLKQVGRWLGTKLTDVFHL